MAIPWRALPAISLVYAYLATSSRSATGFVGRFFIAWVALFFGCAIWVVILYPKLFSPLIGLPEPSGNAWFMGQWSRIIRERPGGPMLDW
jgi:hypothetical protein